jgi:hypothetical protein
MTRNALMVLALVLAGTGMARAQPGNDVQTDGIRIVRPADPDPYPDQPGPYTVIYRAWSDLEG